MDDLDRKLIGCLLENARATYAEIGTEVGLSAPAVKRRVDRLVASGVIKGFTAIVDQRAMGWTTEAYVEVTCVGNVAPEKLRNMLLPVPEVVGACSVTGSPDALVHILARDIAGLERALERLREHPDVEHSRSTIVLSRLIDRPRS